MRVALLTGADPRRSKGGPEVRLRAGKYHLELVNVVSSELRLFIDGAAYPALGQAVEQMIHVDDKGSDVRIDFIQRGKEDHISVYAVKVA